MGRGGLVGLSVFSVQRRGGRHCRLSILIASETAVPYTFSTVPDWFSHENQGGEIAVADLTGGGSQDLVVAMVDSPAGVNRAVYRVGRALDEAGTVTDGWTPWIDIPDWFSAENQGAAVAVADLDSDGMQDLIVAMVDSPDGVNRGLFRIGHGLDGDGIVAGGWTPWIDIPDWFSWENQGIAITVTPPDDQGTRDLIVFTIDNALELNRGIYRIGRGLAVDGTVAAWTGWLDVPDWFSWENAGCGVAVAQAPGGGRDLVIFQIDNAVGQNQAFYRVGKDLDADGLPSAGWQRWMGVPGWFSWENSGGGIAVARLGGTRQLLAFMIDNPPGVNAGLYQVMPLDPDPARDGAWELLPFLSGVLAVHTGLLPNGKVLFFAGSGSSAVRFDSPLFGDEAEGIFTSVVWDPPGSHFSHPPPCARRTGTRSTSSAAVTRFSRRPDALRRRHPGLQPVQGAQRRRHLRLHHRVVVLRRPDGARTVVSHADRSGRRPHSGDHRVERER